MTEETVNRAPVASPPNTLQPQPPAPHSPPVPALRHEYSLAIFFFGSNIHYSLSFEFIFLRSKTFLKSVTETKATAAHE